jgi:hypothetical protein
MTGTKYSGGAALCGAWQLAPHSVAWQGLTTAQVSEQVKDPARNGDRPPDQIIEHMSHDRTGAACPT